MKPDDIKSVAKDYGDSVTDAKRETQGMAGQAADAAGDLYGRAKTAAGQAADAIPDTARDAAAAGRHATEGGLDQFSRQVARQPIEALILASAIGYLVGWATSRS